MRLCALIVIFEVSPNTFEGTGSLNTFLTPEDMLQGYSIHNQAKAKMLNPPSLIWRIFKDRIVLQCFSCLQLSLSKASAKVRKIFHTAKKIFPHVREKVYLCSAFGQLL